SATVGFVVTGAFFRSVGRSDLCLRALAIVFLFVDSPSTVLHSIVAPGRQRLGGQSSSPAEESVSSTCVFPVCAAVHSKTATRKLLADEAGMGCAGRQHMDSTNRSHVARAKRFGRFSSC